MSNFKNTAILSLHMVNDIVTKEGKFGEIFGEQVEQRNVIQNAKKLLNLARSNNIPVIHVAVRFKPGHPDLVPNSPLLSMVKDMDALVEGTWGADFVSELKPLENEVVITHQRVGAFVETELHNTLKNLGIENLILYGVVTNNIVEHSARNAIDLGYTVQVVEDCCSAATLNAHQASIETLGLLAKIVTVEDIENTLTNESAS